jgi:hypothetical protein
MSKFPDLRYKSQNNTFAVYICLYYNRKYNYIKTVVFLTQSEYEDLYSSKKIYPKDSDKAMLEVDDVVFNYIDCCKVYDIGFYY